MSDPISTQPIDDISMTGIHWISASAGTGKTYTLSSVVVRLLLEKYLPKQVIVTTFTRKASNELKVRIRVRLQETLNFLLGIDVKTIQNIQQHEQDPLYMTILQQLDHEGMQRDLNHKIERLKLILYLFDELYIGTLDSLTQKILKEFSFESGQLQKVKISESENYYIQQILHDHLRAWIAQQPEDLIQKLYQNKILKESDEYISIVQNSLHFSSAKWNAIQQPQWIDIDIKAIYQQLSESDEYVDLNSRLKADDFYTADLPKWEQLNHILQKKVWDFYPEKDLRELLKKKYRLKKSADQDVTWHSFWILQQQLCESIKSFETMMVQYQDYLLYEMMSTVQNQLSQILLNEQETTFSAQVQSLSHALHGEQGHHFAKLVQQRYPVLLVDEFQDTNHYQDHIIRTIWRHPERYTQGCCIMVGDDKQAIYGFRGGDMLTYNHARHEMLSLYESEKKSNKKQQVFFYTLIYNHRTIPLLVSAVDALFLRNTYFGEEVIYQPIQAGNRVHDILVEKVDEVFLDDYKPLRWLNITKPKQIEESISPYAFNDIDQIVWQIQKLLAQSQQGDLYFKSSKNQAIRPVTVNDIAVLVTSNKDATMMYERLNQVGIPCLLQSQRSVFDSRIARDVSHILTAVLQPYKEDKIKRALMTQLFALSISQIKQIEKDNRLSDYMQAFAQMKQDWDQYGFLNAWQKFLFQHHIWQNLMYAPYYERERLVINLRHISEILSHYSTVYEGQNHLLSWYNKQINESQNREWEVERQLSQSQGVQILTIHKSKGLEFKIVFCVNQDSIKRASHLVYAISDDNQREIILKNQANTEQEQQDTERQESENHRLWYVALTRASYRLYLCVSDPSKSSEQKTMIGVNYWRLAGDKFLHQGSLNDDLILKNPNMTYQQVKGENNQPLIAVKISNYNQKAFTKTSFTALTLGQINKKQDNLSQNAQFDDGFISELAHESQFIEDYENDQTTSAQTAQTLEVIKRLFPRGKIAGTQLHGLFEKIDIHNKHLWESEINRHFKQDYQLLESDLWQYYQQTITQTNDEQQKNNQVKQLFNHDMCQWILQVIDTPLNSVISLADISTQHRLMEVKFYLALKEKPFNIQQIQSLFAEYQLELHLTEQQTARYLEGAIDLVFFDGQRYHILDYKSNYLGDTFEAYQPQALHDDMTKHQYWLQASLYLIAIHRYLKKHLQGYQIQQHLGSAYYAYLRGMNGQQGQGVYCWKPDDDFILRLDQLLGYSDKYVDSHE